MNGRAAAAVGVVVTGLATVYTVALLAGMPDPNWAYAARGIVHLGELAVLVALFATGAAGRGPMARSGFAVACIGLVMLAAGEVTTNAVPGTSEVLFAIAPNLVGIGLLLLGVAVVRTGAWTGWRRYVPLTLGIVVFAVMTPVMIASGGPPAPAALVTLVVWEVLWVLIGVASLSGAAVRSASTATTPATG